MIRSYVLFRKGKKTGISARLIAIDLTPTMLMRMRTVLGELPEGAKIAAVAGDIEALPLPDAVADLVTANAAFNLCTDKSAAFAEAHRILRPGGRLIARDLIRVGPLPREVLEDPLSDATSLGGVGTRTEMERYMSEAGFTGIEVTDAQPFSYVVSVKILARRTPR